LKTGERTLLCFWPSGDDRATVIAASAGEPGDDAVGSLRQQLSGLNLMTSEALLTTDRALTITSCNRGAELIFGYEAPELIGRSIGDLIPVRFRAEHGRHVAAFASDPRHSLIMSDRGEICALRKDGTEFPAEASIAKAGIGDELGFTVVLRDVTERRRFESELHEARWAAEQASMAKSQFLATMSHELRTPLNAIIGFSQVIENRLFGADLDRYVAYAADIRSSGQHLLEMINDILDLSRIESGVEALQLEPVDPAKLIEASLLLVRERARIAGVTLSVTVDPDAPAARMDRRRIRQVVINLLANAIKFTPSGGRVEVSARPEQGGLALTVTDSGVGIAPEHLSKVFEPFVRIAEHRSLNPEGMGLGLSIARRICQNHGGHIDIASTVGRGTSVKVWLPLDGPGEANSAG
jgi:PAS domain S-box-containing protein